MESFSVIEVLKLGFPGLIFLLSFTSYMLLSQEKKAHEPRKNILDVIKVFMYINCVLAILTILAPIIAPLVESVIPPRDAEESLFNVHAEVSGLNLEKGKSAICQGTNYKLRYILIIDPKTNNGTEVFAERTIPCPADLTIFINKEDATLLGWRDDAKTGSINAIVAPRGYKFVDQPIPGR